jgi:hypothetical protein
LPPLCPGSITTVFPARLPAAGGPPADGPGLGAAEPLVGPVAEVGDGFTWTFAVGEPPAHPVPAVATSAAATTQRRREGTRGSFAQAGLPCRIRPAG